MGIIKKVNFYIITKHISIIFYDFDVFLHKSIAKIQNTIANLNTNSDFKNSISDDLLTPKSC